MDTPSRCHGCTVLMAEDNPTNIALMQAILDMVDCTVTTAMTGVAALQEFKRAHFDLVLMDYHMPEMNGVEAVEAIRAWEAVMNRPPAWIVALTGSSMPDEMARCLAAGMNEVFIKPIDIVKLQDLVRRVCQQHLGAPGQSPMQLA